MIQVLLYDSRPFSLILERTTLEAEWILNKPIPSVMLYKLKGLFASSDALGKPEVNLSANYSILSQAGVNAWDHYDYT